MSPNTVTCFSRKRNRPPLKVLVKSGPCNTQSMRDFPLLVAARSLRVQVLVYIDEVWNCWVTKSTLKRHALRPHTDAVLLCYMAQCQVYLWFCKSKHSRSHIRFQTFLLTIPLVCRQQCATLYAFPEQTCDKRLSFMESVAEVPSMLSSKDLTNVRYFNGSPLKVCVSIFGYCLTSSISFCSETNLSSVELVFCGIRLSL